MNYEVGYLVVIKGSVQSQNRGDVIYERSLTGLEKIRFFLEIMISKDFFSDPTDPLFIS